MIGYLTPTPPDGLTAGRDFEVESKNEDFSNNKS